MNRAVARERAGGLGRHAEAAARRNFPELHVRVFDVEVCVVWSPLT